MAGPLGPDARADPGVPMKATLEWERERSGALVVEVGSHTVQLCQRMGRSEIQLGGYVVRSGLALMDAADALVSLLEALGLSSKVAVALANQALEMERPRTVLPRPGGRR